MDTESVALTPWGRLTWHLDERRHTQPGVDQACLVLQHIGQPFKHFRESLLRVCQVSRYTISDTRQHVFNDLSLDTPFHLVEGRNPTSGGGSHGKKSAIGTIVRRNPRMNVNTMHHIDERAIMRPKDTCESGDGLARATGEEVRLVGVSRQSAALFDDCERALAK